MAATLAPFGFKPIYHPSGVIRPKALIGGIVSGYGTAIFVGQPIKMATTGVIQAASADETILGVFAGCEYTPTGQRPSGGYWPDSTSYETGSMVAYYYDDPELIYAVQCDGSLAQTAVLDCANSSNTSNGSTTTGLSAATLSASLVGAGNPATWRDMDLYNVQDNAWGDTYTIAQVRIAEHQFGGTVNAV